MRGTIALIVSGEKLDLKEVKENIELGPNRVIKIGQNATDGFMSRNFMSIILKKLWVIS